jgi:hypothetical protein
LDQCTLRGTTKQDAPDGASKNKYIRITHPHHPLKGKTCKVIRRARYIGPAGESWVVDLGNGMRMCIPAGCGEIVSGKKEGREPAVGDNHSWAAVADLRKLVALVEELKAAAEGVCDEISRNAGKANCRAARMGASTGSETAGNDPNPERDDLPPDEAGGVQ